MGTRSFGSDSIYRIHMLALREFEKVCDRTAWHLAVSTSGEPTIVFRASAPDETVEAARKAWAKATVGTGFGSVSIIRS